MIVVDSSALVAIVLNEPPHQECKDAIANAEEILISATTLAETLVVAAGKNVASPMALLLDGLPLIVVPVTEVMARSVAQTYARWGKGIHPAGLNFADCFAFALAKERGCPLLFVGNDFSRTDISSARPSTGVHEP